MTRLIERRSDEELAALMTNLAGHDIPSLLEAFERADSDERPKCFIAYTIKGFGLPLQGHKDNHAGLMTVAQMEAWRETMGIAPGEEWEPFAALGVDAGGVPRLPRQGAVRPAGTAAAEGGADPGPRRAAALRPPTSMSTQQGFGLILSDFAKSDDPLADRIVTASPDVTVSTNLGGFVNRRGLFAKDVGRRPVPQGAHSLDLRLGVLAARASTSSSASPRTISSSCFPRSALRIRSKASG